MDFEKMINGGYEKTVWIALSVSFCMVLLGAAIGRGTLNLHGALVTDEPTDVTVIALMEPLLATDDRMSGIRFLRSNETSHQKKTYDYLVETSFHRSYFIRISWNIDEKKWVISDLDQLHGEKTKGEVQEIR